MINIPVGATFESIVHWLSTYAVSIFEVISIIISWIVTTLQQGLLALHPLFLLAILISVAWYIAGRGVAIFTLVGFSLIIGMDLWTETVKTLAMILTSGFLALFIGIPLGIVAARSDIFHRLIRPVLDLMQTMPSFVYLIPAVIFFGMGMVPGVIATVIFSMPPSIRLTNLGIRQVDKEVIEAAKSFGSTPKQMLLKVQLPLAIPTIMAGINQTIMLSLSMVVIASMIGAGGLGGVVLRGITQLKIGLGFEGGLGVVILAIFLDRITQSLKTIRNN